MDSWCFTLFGCCTLDYQHSSGWAFSDALYRKLGWELCSGPAMMEKPPLRGSCFHSLCGNRAQFKEAPSLRGPIVFNGSHPKAALLFPLFQLQPCQTWCDQQPGQPASGSPCWGYDSNIQRLARPVPTSQEIGAFLILEAFCFVKTFSVRAQKAAQSGRVFLLHCVLGGICMWFILDFALCCSVSAGICIVKHFSQDFAC